MVREVQPRIPERGITIRETDLFEVWCHALESGEFEPIRRSMSDGGNGRCALGVGETIAMRAGLMPGMYWHDVHPRISDILDRAGQLLGYEGVMSANDAGMSWKLLAPALRAARIEVERG